MSCLLDVVPPDVIRVRQRAGVTDLPVSPEWVVGAPLQPHQLAALNWLRGCWARQSNALLADDMGQGKTATALAFLHSLRVEFAQRGPVLVVVPANTLAFWEGEARFWLGEGVATAVAAGTVTARNQIYDHELWLLPGSMDIKQHNVRRQDKMLHAKVSAWTCHCIVTTMCP